MATAQFAVVRQLLEGERGRRHRDHAAHDDSGRPVDAKQVRGRRDEQSCECDLKAAAAEDGRARTIIFGRENSSPIMNIRKTTPSSDRNAVPSLGVSSPKPCGPIVRPARR